MKERNLLLAVAALVIVVAAAFALSSPRANRFDSGNETSAVISTAETSERPRPAGSRLCASNAGFQQLKAAAFREAIEVRGDAGSLDRLAATSVVRMEQPEVTSEDAETGLVTCTGRFVIELPPGAERGFGGQRRLAADVSYTARPGADGAAPVYELTGADQLVSTLAAFDIDSSLQQPEPAATTEVRTAQAEPPEQQLPVIIRREPPAQRTAPQEPEERPSPPPARAEREQPKQRPTPPPARPAPREEPPLPRAERPAPARTAARPSFDCRSAGTRSERMVCSSERLAAKDREMARYYFRELNTADERTRRRLEQTRNRFLRYRERCPDEACVADAYDGRMAEIRDIVAGIE